MGKGPAVPGLLRLGLVDGGKQGLVNVAVGSVLTADEYSSEVSAVIHGVEHGSEEKEKMLDLSSALRRLLQTRYDSALPLWWTFTAVEKAVWLDRKSEDPLEFGSFVLNFASRLLGSLKSLTALNASGRTALSAMAPVVGLFFDVASVLSNTVGSLDEKTQNGTLVNNAKGFRKLMRNLKELIKELLSFAILCHYKDSKDFQHSLSLPLAPNFSPENFPNFLYPTFPLASKGMAKSLSRDLSNVAVVADVVAVEAVLLQLVVETIDRRSRKKKQNVNLSLEQDEFVKKLKHIAVHSIWAAGSVSPSEMLLDLLLEACLPVLDLLDAKEENMVRGVLFETVLVDPPLFSLFVQGDGKVASSKSGLDHQSVVFMKKLSVARGAVAFFRSQEQRSQLMTLLTRMTAWRVPPQLLKWLKLQKKQRIPVVALQDPRALTNWLVNTADKSAFTAVLDNTIATGSLGRTSVVTDNIVEIPEVENCEVKLDGDEEAALFFVDTAGETVTSVNAESEADVGFTVAAKSMRDVSDSKKKTKKQTKILFHRREQVSTGTKRSRMEIDAIDVSDSSGEDIEANLSKSARRKTKKSKHKMEVRSDLSDKNDDDSDVGLTLAHSDSSGEGIEANLSKSVRRKAKKSKHKMEVRSDLSDKNDDDSDVELTLAHSDSRGEGIEANLSKSVRRRTKRSKRQMVVGSDLSDKNDDHSDVGLPAQSDQIGMMTVIKNSGNDGSQQRKDLRHPQKSKTPYDQSVKDDKGFGKVANGEAMEEGEAVIVQELTAAANPLDSEEIPSQRTPFVPSQETVMGSVSRSSKRNKEQRLLKDTGGAAMQEPCQETVAAAVSVNGVLDMQNSQSPVISLVDPSTPSVRKSARKTKSNDQFDDQDTGFVAEAGGRSKDGLLLTPLPCEEAFIGENTSKLLPDDQTADQMTKSAKKKKKKKPKDFNETLTQEATADRLTSHDVSLLSGAKFMQPKICQKSENDTDLLIQGKLSSFVEATPVREHEDVSQEAVQDSGNGDISDVPNMGPDSAICRTDKTPGRDVTTVDSLVATVRPNSGKRRPDEIVQGTDADATSLGNNLLVNKTLQVVEARADDVQSVMVKDATQKGNTGSYEEFQIRKSSSSSLFLTPGNRENVDDLGGLGDGRAVVHSMSIQSIQTEARSICVVKTSKRKRLKENANNENDSEQNEIYDTIQDELVSSSVKMSGADIIDVLQVDHQVDTGKLTTPRKMTRFRDVGNVVEEGQAEFLSGTVVAASVAKSNKMKSAIETRQGGVSQVDVTSVDDGQILLSPGDHLGNGQAVDGSGNTDVRAAANSVNLPLVNSTGKSAVGGPEVCAQGTTLPVITPIPSSVNGAAEKTEVQRQATPIVAMPFDPHVNMKRGLTFTPTMGKKRTKGQTEVGKLSGGVVEKVQVKEEVCVPLDEISSADMLQGRNDQDDGNRKTPDPKAEVGDLESVTSAKLSCRTRKVMGDVTLQSAGSETTEERLSPRRTRSGRPFGTPPATPTSKKNMRKKLALERLEEEN